MKRVLLTGMSGVGKSTLIRRLASLGYRAVDIDDPAWSEYRNVPGPQGGPAEPEWVWREARVRDLLTKESGDLLFVSGCASNQGQFYEFFDHVVLLSAPVEVMLERLATRTTNSFGKSPDERAKVLDDVANVEPLLRRRATAEIDTSAPLDDVVATVLRLVGER
jgi:dephospho-CoA kinase